MQKFQKYQHTIKYAKNGQKNNARESILKSFYFKDI